MKAQFVRPAFVAQMEAEIQANAHKGPWDAFLISKEGAKPWLEEHTQKLFRAIEAGDVDGVREFSADVANIAMKIEESLGPKT